MPVPLLGVCAGARVADAAGAGTADAVTGGGGRVLALVHALFPHTIGVLAGLFGFTAVVVGAAEATNSKAEDAANFGGAGLGWLDEQRLREKAAREDAEIQADKAKADAKLKQPKGILDPTNMSLTQVFDAVTASLTGEEEA